MINRSYTVALDLHGSLLDPAWRIPAELVPELTAALESLSEVCRFCLATGNDLPFVRRHVPPPVLDLMDAVVLETGCVLAAGDNEEVLVGEDLRLRVKELETVLRADPPPGVRYFARRLATISLFTRTEEGGADPAGLHPRVVDLVERHGFADTVAVTHSDVAVDIIPRGYSKYTGVRTAAGGGSLIAIADSLNDRDLILGADRAFLPANTSPALLAALAGAGRVVAPLPGTWIAGEAPVEDRSAGDDAAGVIYRSGTGYTRGVIEILRFLGEHLPQQVGPVGDDGINPEPE